MYKPLQNKIKCDPRSLDELYERTKWTPSSRHIRPTPENIEKKEHLMNQIKIFYASFKDYIHESIFNFQMTVNDQGELESTNFGKQHEKVRLIANKFPYQLPEGTDHYVLWYSTEIMECQKPSDDEITTEIMKQLKSLCTDNNPIEVPEFVWYENPKINREIYHVQVFVRNKNSSSGTYSKFI